MSKLGSLLTSAALLAALAGPAWGQIFDDIPGLSPPESQRPASALEKFSARAVLSHKTVRGGDSLHVALEMTIAESYWVYGPDAGGKIVPAQDLTVQVGATPLEVGPVLFTPAKSHKTLFPDGSVDTHLVYEGRAYAFAEVTVPVGLKSGKYPLALTISGQLCDPEICLQLDTTITAEVTVGDATVASADWTDQVRAALGQASYEDWGEPAGGDRSAWVALPLALLAGLILNIMPCVLPVIPLKLLSLVQQSKESPRRFVTLGLAFAGGIVLFFVCLAAFSAVMRIGVGYTLKWGDMFQYSAVIYVLVLVLTAFAANMFGAFTVLVPRKLAEVETGEGHLGSVGMGFFTAVLSTPCSFAILASAFLWAQSQRLALGTIGIIMIGMGMAAPYVVMTLLPKLVARIPRAGRWTELFKQSVGFVMLLVAMWLLSTQMTDSRPAWVAAYAVVLAMCLWAWGSWVRFDAPAGRKWGIRSGALIVAVAAGLWMLPAPDPLAVKFEPFDAARISEARRRGQAVLVDFTASWCLTCKTVEKLVYDDPNVARELESRGVVAMKGDVTHRGSPADRMLTDKLREPGVPVSVIFPPGQGRPIRLRGLFSKGALLKALDDAGAKAGESPPPAL